MMDDVQTMEDLSDYLQSEIDDMFIYLGYPSVVNEFQAPSSKSEKYSGTLYFLASRDKNRTIGNWVEIADISGDGRNGGMFVNLMNNVFKWMRPGGNVRSSGSEESKSANRDENVHLVGMNCRESTSDRFFRSRFFLGNFRKNGYIKLDDVENTEEIDDEKFHLNILVDEKWWKSLSEDAASRVKRMVEYIIG